MSKKILIENQLIMDNILEDCTHYRLFCMKKIDIEIHHCFLVSKQKVKISIELGYCKKSYFIGF